MLLRPRPDKAARAALTASIGPGLALTAPVLPVSPARLHHPDPGRSVPAPAVTRRASSTMVNVISRGRAARQHVALVSLWLSRSAEQNFAVAWPPTLVLSGA